MDIVGLDVVEAAARGDQLEVGVAQGRLQGHRDAVDVARLAFSSHVAQGFRVDLAVAIAVVVGTHVLGEAVGALEALLAGEFAHPVVHPGKCRQEGITHVDRGAGGRAPAGALHVVGVVAGVEQVGDDFQLGVGMRVGVDVVHCRRHISLAVGYCIVDAGEIAGAGLRLERRTCLQAIIAAHLEGHHAGRAGLHPGAFGDNLVVVDIGSDRARLGPADALDVRIPLRRQVLGIHGRGGVARGIGGRAVVAGVDRVAIGHDPVLGAGPGPINGPGDVLVECAGQATGADCERSHADKQPRAAAAKTNHHVFSPKSKSESPGVVAVGGMTHQQTRRDQSTGSSFPRAIR